MDNVPEPGKVINFLWPSGLSKTTEGRMPPREIGELIDGQARAIIR